MALRHGRVRSDLAQDHPDHEVCDDGIGSRAMVRTTASRLAAVTGFGEMIGRTVNEVEACDDGNQWEDDACRTNCRHARCSDGVRTDIAFGAPGFEECDDGSQVATDACTDDCGSALQRQLRQGDLAPARQGTKPAMTETPTTARMQRGLCL